MATGNEDSDRGRAGQRRKTHQLRIRSPLRWTRSPNGRPGPPKAPSTFLACCSPRHHSVAPGNSNPEPNTYQNFLRLQITSLGQCSTSLKEVSKSSDEDKDKWKMNFLKYLRSPKDVQQQESSEAKNHLGDAKSGHRVHLMGEKMPVVAREAHRKFDGEPTATAQNTIAMQGQQFPSYASDKKLLSTTAHLLSLLEPDDIKNFVGPSIISGATASIASTSVGHLTSKPAKALQPPLQSSLTFQTTGSNGNKLIEEILLSKSWTHLSNGSQAEVKLLWAENLTQVNICNFKEGSQLLNHIPNAHILSNKLYLLRCLQEFNAISKRSFHIRMGDFVPETYRLDLKQDRHLYCQVHKDGELWICKPVMFNQGKGIFLVRNSEELKNHLRQIENEEISKNHFSKPINVRIIQRYITSPLLLEGRKADIRTYMLIASTKPFVVLFHEGYVRLSCNQYDPSSADILTHLTNQCMQRKNPHYEAMKEETVWNMERLGEYMGENIYFNRSMGDSWVHSSFQNQMCRIMLYCFHAVKAKLDRRVGLFELLGFDFLIDCSLKVWLLEINVNPSLQINCQVLRQIIPFVLEESIDIANECMEKVRQGIRILPLQSKKKFILLYCEEMPFLKTIPDPTPPLKRRFQSYQIQANKFNDNKNRKNNCSTAVANTDSTFTS